jgi:MFS superfamily sulfate permease-like transporter
LRIRLQGPLAFSTAEVELRRAIDAVATASTILFDCQRVQSVDAAACRLFRQFVDHLIVDGGTVVFAGLREGDGWEPLFDDLNSEYVQSFATVDLALECCEDRILSDAAESAALALEIDINTHPLLLGLTTDERSALRSTMTRKQVEAGATPRPSGRCRRFAVPADGRRCQHQPRPGLRRLLPARDTRSGRGLR